MCSGDVIKDRKPKFQPYTESSCGTSDSLVCCWHTFLECDEPVSFQLLLLPSSFVGGAYLDHKFVPHTVAVSLVCMLPVGRS